MKEQLPDQSVPTMAAIPSRSKQLLQILDIVPDAIILLTLAMRGDVYDSRY